MEKKPTKQQKIKEKIELKSYLELFCEIVSTKKSLLSNKNICQEYARAVLLKVS